MKKLIVVLGSVLAMATSTIAQDASWAPEKQKESEFTGRKLETFKHGTKK